MSAELKKRIQDLSSLYLEEIIITRRHLHANPELSFEEYNTSKFIASKLKEFDIPFKDNIVKTGIVALISGTKKNPSAHVIALRADIDALPIEEKNAIDYKSKNVGVMHACGHDVHTSALLGAAKILNDLKDEFSGTIKLLFQPGEEKAPGGASLMIKEGVLDNPRPSAIYAQHVFPSLDAGKVGFRGGKYMASTDEIYFTIKGKGGHAAMQGTYLNPLLIASKILVELESKFLGNNLLALQQLKGVKENIPTVLAFGKINGNGATNVIPDEVHIEGTFRTMNEIWRQSAHAIIRETALSLAKQSGGDCQVNIVPGYPVLINNEKVTADAMQYAKEYLGKENVIDLDLRMTGEDFAFFAEKIPACFYRLGTGNAHKGITAGVHTPTFNIDESSLQTGMGLLAWIAIQSLENSKNM
ncbi:MAG TPA: M20 family metallopeptidase [Bacteroidia bacterium]|nr:M20 family metallopeptidase [Bacteroidia bacterium]